MFDPNKVMRLVQNESDGCMYEVGRDDKDEEQYVYAKDYDALLTLYSVKTSARASFEAGMDIGAEHSRQIVSKLKAKMDSGIKTMLDEAEALIQAAQKKHNSATETKTDIDGTPV